jgi:hypothetical protein
MRTFAKIILGAAAALLLFGCANTPPAVAPAAPGVAVTTPEPAAETGPQLSERGLIPSTIGQEVRLDAPGADPAASDPVIRFTITKAEFVDSCGEATRYTPATRPENGHFLRLQVEVHTGRDYSHALSPFVMPQWVDDQGITHAQAWTSAVMMCAGSKGSLPSNMGPGQNYKGWVLLDVPSTSGTVLLQTMGYQTGKGEGAGWEFPIGQTA